MSLGQGSDGNSFDAMRHDPEAGHTEGTDEG